MTLPANLYSAVLVNILIVILAVIMHQECLLRLNHWIPRIRRRHFRLIAAVTGTLTAHTLQVWLFALAFYLMHHAEGWGELVGNFSGSLPDCVYFSFTNFTTLGYGDVEPLGLLRYLTGIEALTGLVLITWSASFLYLEMQRYWPAR